MLTNQITSHFPNLSEQQASVVGHVHGPLLVIAGPGSGKTTTLVLRALNLIVGGYAHPREVMICTFSQNAARELRQRFDRAASEIGCRQDLSGVQIGTIHGFCNSILKEGDGAMSAGPDLQTLDSLQQMAFIQSRLEEITSPQQAHKFVCRWGAAGVAKALADSFNTMSERLIDPQMLIASQNALHRALGECYVHYMQTLRRHRKVDFSYLQRWTLDLLSQEDGSVPVARDVKWLMVDEYQDTNPVQEQLLLALARSTGNIAVVGDDDQSIYGFRGATVRNLLDFPTKFPNCSVNLLTTNYRSAPGIVDACNRWMQDAANAETAGPRYEKDIAPFPQASQSDYPSVVRIWATDPDDEAQQVAAMVAHLKDSGVIERYGQVALLLNSVQHRISGPYVSAMRAAGVPAQVHGERKYFCFGEIKDMVACFALIMGWTARQGTGDRQVDRYVVEAVNDLLDRTPHDSVLSRALLRWQGELAGLSERDQDLDRSLLDYFYVLLALDPFIGLQGRPRSMVNLAAWSRFLSTFQTLYGYDKVRAGQVEAMQRDFLTKFLPLVFWHGVAQREVSDVIPEGDCVRIMTVHQSKGLEFPVVVAGGLTFKSRDRSMQYELVRYAPDWDPTGENGCAGLDGARRQYVAFTRARNLLVLASSAVPAQDVPAIWTNAVDWGTGGHGSLRGQRFALVGEPEEFDTYSVTGDILLYDTCPRRYEFFRHYGFEEKRSDAAAFGTLAHACMERVSRILVDGSNPATLGPVVEALVAEEVERLGTAEHLRFSDQWVRDAERQVKGFLKHVESVGMAVLGSEVEVDYEGEGWRVTGRVDLLADVGGRLTVLDLKSGRQPTTDAEVVQQYRKQVSLYGLMAEQSLGCPVESFEIFWMGEDVGADPVMEFEDTSAGSTKPARLHGGENQGTGLFHVATAGQGDLPAVRVAHGLQKGRGLHPPPALKH